MIVQGSTITHARGSDFFIRTITVVAPGDMNLIGIAQQGRVKFDCAVDPMSRNVPSKTPHANQHYLRRIHGRVRYEAGFIRRGTTPP